MRLLDKTADPGLIVRSILNPVTTLTWKSFSKWTLLSIVSLVVFVVVCNLGVYLTTKDFIFDNIADVPETEIVLIPGAAVSEKGVLSPIFTDRVDTAIALYEAEKVSKILVSGDNSTLSYNEVNPVRLYLLGKGVPEADIFLDHAGFDTYSSMYRARDVFEVTAVIISTQSFHLPRAIFIARRLGLEAYGINADEGTILKKNYIREVFATVKAVLDLVLLREPKYLGEPIPIAGTSATR